MKKTMMLINAEFVINNGTKRVPTFSLIPVDNDSPYTMAIYDPSNKVLGIVSKIETHPYRMLPKPDDNGDVTYTKNRQRRPNGKDYKEERRVVDSFQEYELTHLEDISYLIDNIAVNTDRYDYKLFFKDLVVETEPVNTPPDGKPVELTIVKDEETTKLDIDVNI